MENGIIEIIADNGLTGYGAFNPSYEVIGEKLDNALSVLSPENLSQLIGKDLSNIDAVCADIQKIYKTSITARTG